MPDFDSVKKAYTQVYKGVQNGKITAAYAVERGGVLAAAAKMALGNGIGAQLTGDIDDFTQKAYGDIVIEGEGLDFEVIGQTGGDAIALNGEAVALSSLREGVCRDAFPRIPAARRRGWGSAGPALRGEELLRLS